MSTPREPEDQPEGVPSPAADQAPPLAASLLRGTASPDLPVQQMAAARLDALRPPDGIPTLGRGRAARQAFGQLWGAEVRPRLAVLRQERRARFTVLALISLTVLITLALSFFIITAVRQPTGTTPQLAGGAHGTQPPTTQQPGSGAPTQPAAGGIATATPPGGVVGAAPTATLLPGQTASPTFTPNPAATATNVPAPTATTVPPTNTPAPPPPFAELLANPGLDDYSGWCSYDNVGGGNLCDGPYDNSYIETNHPAHGGGAYRAHWSANSSYDVTTYQQLYAPVSGTYYASLWFESSQSSNGVYFFLKNMNTHVEYGTQQLWAGQGTWANVGLGGVYFNKGDLIAFEVHSVSAGPNNYWVRFDDAHLDYH